MKCYKYTELKRLAKKIKTVDKKLEIVYAELPAMLDQLKSYYSNRPDLFSNINIFWQKKITEKSMTAGELSDFLESLESLD